MIATDLAGKRVVVVGLGVSGFSAAKALTRLDAKVRVTEGGSSPTIQARADELQALGVDVEVGGHDLDALDADLAVISPGIPPTAPIAKALRDQDIELWSEVELAYRLADCDFLAVTGTNGKTTTTSLLVKMLEAGGVATVAAGNIGFPLVDAISSVPSSGAIAVEVSSFQLETTYLFRPKVAVLLNIAEDHTDWHGSFQSYRDAKARIVANQTTDDMFLPNADDEGAMSVAGETKARVVPFSAQRLPAGGIGIEDGKVVWDGGAVIDLDDIPLPGVSGLEDAVAAGGAALGYGVPREAVAQAIRSFDALSHRFQVIARHDGVTYIDDSKATNPHATLAALRGMNDVVLIAGGDAKGIDLGPLRVAAPSLTAVVALGKDRDAVARAFEGAVGVELVDTMEDAVAAAHRRTSSGGSVLLSPACASLDMYENYAARGDHFARCVRDLIERSTRRKDGNT